MATIQVVIEDHTRDELVNWAIEDHRTLSNLCNILLTEAVADRLLQRRPRKQAR